MNSDHRRPSRQLIDLLSRALLDREVCNVLFEEPDAVAKAFGLRPEEAQAIKRLDRQTFGLYVTLPRPSPSQREQPGARSQGDKDR